MKADKEQFRISKTGGHHAVELMHGAYSTHEFPRHFHDGYVIQVVVEGVNAFCHGRETYRIGPGDVAFFNPGEVHTGKSVDGRRLEYRAFYPTLEGMTAIAEAASLTGGTPEFIHPVAHDPALAQRLFEAHVMATNRPSSITDDLVNGVLLDALARYGRSKTTLPPRDPDRHEAVRRIRELVSLEPARNWSLSELAEACSYSPYYLVRLFTRIAGIPPHEYLQAYRAERARGLLREGRRAWEAATLLGFADQAHFTRVFRRIVGLTPGAFRTAHHESAEGD